MSQIIQNLQNGTDAAKGLLTRSVSDLIKKKALCNEPLTALEADLRDLIGGVNSPDFVKRLKKVKLLSPGLSNPKTAKDAGLTRLSNWILHLSPSDLSGVNICPSASAGCRAACLNGAGRGLFDEIQLARLRRTLYFVKFRGQFLEHLDKEIGKIAKKDKKKTIVVRLNGTSDLSWECFKIRDGLSIFELYPQIQFYDYTKVFSRLTKIKGIQNYNVTFSCNESNWSECLQALNLGVNVATVFRTEVLPVTYQGFQVINGDIHDFRFLDARGAVGLVVGLKAKGPAKKDASGFVKDIADADLSRKAV